ncbi:hypothetical protein [Pleomorphomonas sp. PLEO]|uniref:hypothetical protein n=1 Tax=Pleomorphomonas sp. PLEO TaxID=3239306 RepID=UPI00351F29B8
MKRLLVTAAAASFLVAASSTGAFAFNMNVPKSVIVAAIEAPTVSSAERTLVFPPLTFLSVAGDYAARVRAEVINVFAPGIISGIGAAYQRALGAPATSAVPEVVAI